jgi:hypothetical protein
MTAAAIDLLQREYPIPIRKWSLGTFGAIAEFSRDHDEQVRLVQSTEAVSAVTPRGGIGLRASIRQPLRRPTTGRPFIMRADLTRKWGFFDRK